MQKFFYDLGIQIGAVVYFAVAIVVTVAVSTWLMSPRKIDIDVQVIPVTANQKMCGSDVPKGEKCTIGIDFKALSEAQSK